MKIARLSSQIVLTYYIVLARTPHHEEHIPQAHSTINVITGDRTICIANCMPG